MKDPGTQVNAYLSTDKGTISSFPYYKRRQYKAYTCNAHRSKGTCLCPWAPRGIINGHVQTLNDGHFPARLVVNSWRQKKTMIMAVQVGLFVEKQKENPRDKKERQIYEASSSYRIPWTHHIPIVIILLTQCQWIVSLSCNKMMVLYSYKERQNASCQREDSVGQMIAQWPCYHWDVYSPSGVVFSIFISYTMQHHVMQCLTHHGR